MDRVRPNSLLHLFAIRISLIAIRLVALYG